MPSPDNLGLPRAASDLLGFRERSAGRSGVIFGSATLVQVAAELWLEGYICDLGVHLNYGGDDSVSTD